MSCFQDVRDFHQTFDLTVRDTPGRMSHSEISLRLRLVTEEFVEFVQALVGHELPALRASTTLLVAHAAMHSQPYDPADVAREAVDLTYVINGTGVQAGIDLDAAWRAVHAANMAKVGRHGEIVRDSGGKVVRPPGWVAPDVAAAIGLPEAA